MSDVFLNDSRYTIVLNNVSNSNRHSFDKEYEIISQGNVLEHCDDIKMYRETEHPRQQQFREEMNVPEEIIERCFEGELNRLKSKLVNVISEASKSTNKLGATGTDSAQYQSNMLQEEKGNNSERQKTYSVTRNEINTGNCNDTSYVSINDRIRVTDSSLKSPYLIDQSNVHTKRRIMSKRSYTDEDCIDDVKTRQKKLLHNRVEQKRRRNITDRISELRLLLPESANREVSKRKVCVLNESIKYIKSLRNDNERYYQVSEGLRDAESRINTLTMRVDEIECRVTQAVLNRSKDVLKETRCKDIRHENETSPLYSQSLSYQANVGQTSQPLNSNPLKPIDGDEIGDLTAIISSGCSSLSEACTSTNANENFDFYI